MVVEKSRLREKTKKLIGLDFLTNTPTGFTPAEHVSPLRHVAFLLQTEKV